jgi:hypothetical protein
MTEQDAFDGYLGFLSVSVCGTASSITAPGAGDTNTDIQSPPLGRSSPTTRLSVTSETVSTAW